MLTNSFKKRLVELAGINDFNYNPFHKEPVYFHGGRNENIEDDLKKGAIFISTSERFADAYGAYIWQVKVDLGKIFDSTKIEFIEMLHKNGIKLSDSNITFNTPVDFIEYIKKTKSNYSAIEKISSVIFKLGYDSIKLLEEGNINYLIKSKNVLGYYMYGKLIPTKNLNEFYQDIQPKQIDNNYFYHVSSFANRENITKFGLLPSLGDSTREHSKKWLKKPVIFVGNDLNHLFARGQGDVWKIDKSKINNIFYPDQNHSEDSGQFYTFEPIPASAIELVKK